MPAPVAVALVALALNIFMGGAVLAGNPSRPVNRWFGASNALAGCWLILLAGAFSATDAGPALMLVRACHAVGFVYFTTVASLVSCIVWPGRGPPRAWAWYAADAAAAVACLGPWLVPSVLMPGHGARMPVAEPAYGPMLFPYVAGVLAKCAWAGWALLGPGRRLAGAARVEAQYVLLGLAACLLLGVSTTMVVPLATGRADAVVVAPCWVLLMNLIIAYGLATRRLMRVGAVVRRAAGWLLLALYAAAVFGLAWWVASGLLGMVGGGAPAIAPLVASVATVLSMAPAAGVVHGFVRRLLMSPAAMDSAAVAKRSSLLLGHLAPPEQTAADWAELLRTASGAEFVLVATRRADGAFAGAAGDGAPEWVCPPGSALGEALEGGGPLVADMIPRMRPDARLADAREQMLGAGAAMAMPLRSGGEISGIVLVGPRPSGRIYGADEIDILSLLCSQMSLAMDNARLFGEVALARRRSEEMLARLPVGVIASGPGGRVQECNREAARLLGAPADSLLDSPVSGLPPPLAEAMLVHGGEGPEREALLPGPGGRDLVVRYAAAPFGGGALLVVADVTRLRAMEVEVRRRDRLTSLGTLAAGAAHEIRNPLVAVNTFAQLLPERHGDPEFRERFSGLVVEEVARIDRILDRMLQFGRVAAGGRRRVSMRAEAGAVAELLHHRARSSGVEILGPEPGEEGWVSADPDGVRQVLLNLAMNAIDAMPRGGRLSIAVAREDGGGVLLRVSDTGPGVPPEIRDRIFDPFFTFGKSGGTGLGLSVAHGILAEHGARIALAPSASGAVFEVRFPPADGPGPGAPP